MYKGIKEESMLLFSEPKDGMDRNQMEFVDRHIGSAHVKTPEEIRNLFQYAEKKDKEWNRQVFQDNRKLSLLNVVPTFWQRKFLYVPKNIMKIGYRIKKALA